MSSIGMKRVAAETLEGRLSKVANPGLSISELQAINEGLKKRYLEVSSRVKKEILDYKQKSRTLKDTMALITDHHADMTLQIAELSNQPGAPPAARASKNKKALNAAQVEAETLQQQIAIVRAYRDGLQGSLRAAQEDGQKWQNACQAIEAQKQEVEAKGRNLQMYIDLMQQFPPQPAASAYPEAPLLQVLNNHYPTEEDFGELYGLEDDLVHNNFETISGAPPTSVDQSQAFIQDAGTQSQMVQDNGQAPIVNQDNGFPDLLDPRFLEIDFSQGGLIPAAGPEESLEAEEPLEAGETESLYSLFNDREDEPVEEEENEPLPDGPEAENSGSQPLFIQGLLARLEAGEDVGFDIPGI
ncbi:uncharacterized protein F4822DRAFT_427535 [Hypoxylon trugodes]|uniref:uncharacterized protein n=1 Tax=Hypoxylon trugodes TaxID=326681 RepID=UPI002195A57E|nr:uncharacterized protein F4822DRAFT_427535 [Hypoxylon trugodes]KAI1391678.1 hypothetical protein F4822DRAFT_427535 [Hypoxylon trugodes]